jgi:hypothetical protein
MKQKNVREPSHSAKLSSLKDKPESTISPHPYHNSRKELLYRFLLLLIIVALTVLLYLLGVGCPIKYYTGISCPCCGMTRAVWAALHLDFSTACHYHPLYPLIPVMTVLLLLQNRLSRKLTVLFWTLLFLLFLLVYLVRIFLIKDGIVTADPSSGYLMRLLHFLIK